MTVTLHCGDNRIILRTMADNSVDAIVCDPPYELGFMGKRWDSSGIAYDVTLWSECLRVLKPGGHLIAFGGTRTYHRMTVAIEDAGFEIRDCLSWIYGSGFPKSLDVSKAIDKQNKDNQQKRAQEQLERRYRFTEWVRSTGLKSRQIDEATGTNMGGHYTTATSQPAIMTRAHLDAVRHLIGDVPEWVEVEVDVRTLGIEESEAWKAREVVGSSDNGIAGGTGKHAGESERYGFRKEYNITAPHLDAAKAWHGFGTALKPAHEPAVLARKPLTSTVADNVMAWGTGALNIDGCRIGGEGGRWPANLILDEEAAALLDAQSGGASRFFYTAKSSRAEREAGLDSTRTVKYNYGKDYTGGLPWKDVNTVAVQLLQRATSDMEALKWLIDESGENITALFPSDSSFITSMETSKTTALKTFSLLTRLLTSESTADANCETANGSSLARNAESLKAWLLSTTNATTELALGAVNVASTTLSKISESEPQQRNNSHSTVKPLDLMRYLVRLVTPPGGIVLDPFMGSGSTGCAAVLEGMSFVGIDITPEYVEIARRRIAHHGEQPRLI